jgi:hypothetical protein
MKNLLPVIAGDKVPYLITILFASVGWIIVHSVDRLNSSPTVTYKLVPGLQGCSPKCFTVEIRNVTTTVLLKDLVISVHLEGQDSSSKIQHADIIPVQPAWNGDTAPNWEAGDSADFPIATLQPGWEFKLVTRFSGGDTPHVYLTKSPDPIRFVEPSIDTFFLNHEAPIICVVLLIYAGFVTLVIIRFSKDS